MKTYRHHIISKDSVNIIFDDEVTAIRKDNPMFKDVTEALKDNDFDKVVRLVDVAGRLMATSDKRMWVNNGVIYIEGEGLPDGLSKTVIAFLDNKLNVEPLYKFWQNLKKNPSMESRKDLYGFLAANKIPITADGCFVAYKMVDSNFKDLHTGKNDNRVGKVVKMDRDKVNPDRNVTCASGLHGAAFEYANTFGSGHLMELKINPKDVVTVPIDYNQQKMRICEYKVVRECEIRKEREDILYTDDDSYDDSYDEEDAWNEEGDFVDSLDRSDEEMGEVVNDIGTPNYDTPIVNVKTDKSGRLGIPSSLIKALGLKPGDNAYVELTDGLRIYANGSTSSDVIYKVDKNYNIRLSPSTLKGVVDDKKEYILELINDEENGETYILVN